MIRLYVVVEGQTEEAFVKAHLGPHLLAQGVCAIPIIVSTSSAAGGRKRKGGGSWKNWRSDLTRILREQVPGGGWVTTMFDLYGLPRDFPDLARIRGSNSPTARVRLAEDALVHDLGEIVEAHGFIPYVQQHEYEALVLVCLADLPELLDNPADIAGVEALRQEIGDTAPEDINDGAETAPSKRLERHIPGYDKVLHGELALWNATMTLLTSRCPHFGTWVRRLEGLKDGVKTKTLPATESREELDEPAQSTTS